ncbi:putative cupin domain-containing protein [Rosellinia necatrix]|uniref:Putative cupin domain-containing protein n=1 Tax=Rosellinia necatrix TaxID=77044 RepID=A0A1W2TJ52_ROSNE|nr:putative cupin domain-containing protein [Rosellinia necatrix]
MSRSGPCTGFPAPGLRKTNRYITGHNSNGDPVFLQSDNGDHQTVMIGGAAAQNIFYSSYKTPIELTGNEDLELAKKNPSLHIPNGSVVRMIDFAPGVESNLHRSLSLVIGTVCEGTMEITLGSGEKRTMVPGDVSINRACMHKWRNPSETAPARMLYVLLDVAPVIVNGKALDFDMGYLMQEYADYEDGQGPKKD